MINVKYYLKSKQSDKPVSVVATIRHSGNKVSHATGVTIHPKLWDHSKQLPLVASKAPKEFKSNPFLKEELDSKRVQLSSLQNELMNAVNTHQAFLLRGEVPYEKLKALILAHRGDSKMLKDMVNNKSKTPYLLEYCTKFIEGMSTGKTFKDDSKRYGPGTIRQWKSWLMNFKLFLNSSFEYNKLEFDGVNQNLCDAFVHFCYHERGMAINTAGRMVKNLKAVMRRAHKEQWHSNLAFTHFRKPTMDKTIVVLSDEEVKMLYDLDLTGSPWEKYRDIFLVGCYTALRVSDLSRITKDNLLYDDEFPFLAIKTKKTKKDVTIPLSKTICLPILEKYDYSLPKFSSTKLNKYIKLIAKKAGLDYDVKINFSEGGEEKEIAVPKYKLIASHTARRTGATMLVSKGVSLSLVMTITGHKTEASLRRYINIDKKERMREMKNNPLLWS